VGKRQKYKRTSSDIRHYSSLDTVLAESRALRRQVARDLSREVRSLRRMTRRVTPPK